MMLEDRCVETVPQAETQPLGRSCLVSSAGPGWVPRAVKERPSAEKKPSACEAVPRAAIPAEGCPVPLWPAHQGHPDMLSSPCVSISLQSPPKLNEVSSDATRENAAAESGSESSSQEATPEKGMLRSHHLVGRVPSDRGTVHPHPGPGGTWAPARCSTSSHT